MDSKVHMVQNLMWSFLTFLVDSQTVLLHLLDQSVYLHRYAQVQNHVADVKADQSRRGNSGGQAGS